MIQKIEGLLISKIPYQERHIIAKILLRNGKQVSVLFFGGAGGGKKQKSSILELGFMLKIELAASKSTNELYHAKEWDLIWSHQKIRLNHQAFYVMCFYLELVGKISPHDHLHDYTQNEFDGQLMQEFVGLFRVASNGLVHLEKTLEAGLATFESETTLFLGKLLIELGLFPHRTECAICGIELKNVKELFLMPQQGGFVCSTCHKGDQMSQRSLWELMNEMTLKKYSEIENLGMAQKHYPKILLQFLSFQLHLDEKSFKSFAMIS